MAPACAAVDGRRAESRAGMRQSLVLVVPSPASARLPAGSPPRWRGVRGRSPWPSLRAARNSPAPSTGGPPVVSSGRGRRRVRDRERSAGAGGALVHETRTRYRRRDPARPSAESEPRAWAAPAPGRAMPEGGEPPMHLGNQPCELVGRDRLRHGLRARGAEARRHMAPPQGEARHRAGGRREWPAALCRWPGQARP
jgi:hypothetical protein